MTPRDDLVRAFVLIALLPACAATMPGQDGSHAPMHDHAMMQHGAPAGPGMEHAGHGSAEGRTGTWSYLGRANPEPYREKRWEMVPVPGYGHMYVSAGGLQQALFCDALRDNPGIMVDRATRAACGIPGTSVPEEHGDREHHTTTDERSPERAGPHEHWAAPEDAAKLPNPVPADRSSFTRGRSLFEKHCVVCHGHGGRGDGPAATGLAPRPPDLVVMGKQHPAGDLAWKIENGRGPMPAWRGVLKAQDIWDLVNFIRSLK